MSQTRCPGCGRPCSSGQRYCPECGSALTGGRTGSLRDLAIVIGVIAVFTLGYFLLRKPEPRPEARQDRLSNVPGHGDIAGLAQMEGLPADYEGLVAAGNRYMDDGNHVVAAEAYRRALALSPVSVDVRTDYGACLFGMGLPERAIEEFRTALANDSRHAIALFNMGIVYHDLGQADSARVYWQRCLDADPKGVSVPAVRQLLDSLRG